MEAVSFIAAIYAAEAWRRNRVRPNQSPMQSVDSVEKAFNSAAFLRHINVCIPHHSDRRCAAAEGENSATQLQARFESDRYFWRFLAMTGPLMPKATAVWLVDNTGLTFDQIGALSELHPLEVQALADGDIGQGIKGRDPIANGELTREEIARCEADPNARLVMSKLAVPRAGGADQGLHAIRRSLNARISLMASHGLCGTTRSFLMRRLSS